MWTIINPRRTRIARVHFLKQSHLNSETGSHAEQATWPNQSISVVHAYYLYAYSATFGDMVA